MDGRRGDGCCLTITVPWCRYRKAPQYVFPAAYEDCLGVTRYVVSNAHHLGINRDRIMVAGDGAGGNLAAAVALTTKDKLVLQVCPGRCVCVC